MVKGQQIPASVSVCPSAAYHGGLLSARSGCSIRISDDPFSASGRVLYQHKIRSRVLVAGSNAPDRLFGNPRHRMHYTHRTRRSRSFRVKLFAFLQQRVSIDKLHRRHLFSVLLRNEAVLEPIGGIHLGL